MKKKKTLNELLWEAGIFDDPVGEEIYKLFSQQKATFKKEVKEKFIELLEVIEKL